MSSGFFVVTYVAGWELWFCSVCLCVSRVAGCLPMNGFVQNPLERFVRGQRSIYLQCFPQVKNLFVVVGAVACDGIVLHL